MFLRLLFVLLAALNIAVGAWLLLGQPYARGGNPSDPGIPELHLLSEIAESASVTPAAMTAVAPVDAERDAHSRSCLRLGPFASPQDLRDARQALVTRVLRMRWRQEQTNQNVGWRVYLPASSRAQALAMVSRLEASHINDYYVVSSGDQANTISLGLFKEAVNAQKRLDQVVAAGLGARMSERSETVPEYWLDLAVADRAHFDWRTSVHAAGVGSHNVSCF